MPKIESEKIDCLYRPCSRPVYPRQSNPRRSKPERCTRAYYGLDNLVSRQECERQQCERHQCEANSANANSAKGSTVRMPTVRMRQRCECQQCECDSSAKDDSPNRAKPCPQLRQLDLDFSTSVLSFFTHLSHTRDRRLASEIPLELSTWWPLIDWLLSTVFGEGARKHWENNNSARNRIFSVETDKLEPRANRHFVFSRPALAFTASPCIAWQVARDFFFTEKSKFIENQKQPRKEITNLAV